MPPRIRDMRDVVAAVAAHGLKKDWISRHRYWKRRLRNTGYLAMLAELLPPDLCLFGRKRPRAPTKRAIPLQDGVISSGQPVGLPPRRPRYVQTQLDNWVVRRPRENR